MPQAVMTIPDVHGRGLGPTPTATRAVTPT